MSGMRFKGDRTADYSRSNRTGLVGKVLGPNLQRRYFLVTEATYDADIDMTFATVEPLLDPEIQLARIQEEQA